MGVDAQFRIFLMKTLATRAGAAPCFYSALPAEASANGFDVVVVDHMQYVAAVKHAAGMTGAMLKERCRSALAPYLSDNDPRRARLTVVCLDNAFAVPRNKAFVEAQRDSSGETPSTDEDGGPVKSAAHAPPSTIVASNGEFAAIEATARAAVRETLRAECMDAGASMVEMAAVLAEHDARFSAATDFLVHDGPLPTDGSKVWRNVALSWQLKRLITEGLCALALPPGRHALLDDGLLIDAERYRALRATMLAENAGHGETARSPLGEATLVGQLMSACVERVLLAPGQPCRALPPLGLGESDLKIVYYVQRRAPLGLEPRSLGARTRYLIKCQDTDVMWQLMAHMRALINPATGVIDEVDVWMDTQTPADESKGVSREYRFIDVVALWRQTHDWLAADFPVARNRLETLLALVFCNGNDYVERFAPFLKIGATTLWNTFFELLAAGSERATYPSASGARARVGGDALRTPLAQGMCDLLVCAEPPPPQPLLMGVDVTPTADTAVCLRRDTMATFFYWLVSRSPTLRTLAGRHADTRWATDFDRPQAVLDFAQLLAPHAPPGAPPLLGVPVYGAMHARVARLEWTLNYYVNGWKTPAYRGSWFELSGECARYGWVVVDVTDSPVCLPGSQYLHSEYEPPRPPSASGDDFVPGRYRYYMPQVVSECTAGAF